MKINLFFGSYSMLNNYAITISKSQANAGKFTTVTIDSAHNWTIPSSIPTSDYGYVIYELDTLVEDDFGSGTSTFVGYRGYSQLVYIPHQSTRTIKYVSNEILSINGKNFYCPDANETWVGQYILVPANEHMITYLWLLDTPVTDTDDTSTTGGRILAIEYMMNARSTNIYKLIIDNAVYPNSVEYLMDSKPGYTYQGGLSIYEGYSDEADPVLKTRTYHHTSETIFPLRLIKTTGSMFFAFPCYVKTYVAPKLDTSTLTVNSDGSVSWSYSFLLDSDSVKDNRPTSCKMKLTTDGVSSAYFTPSGYTTDYVSESVPSGKVRVTYSGTAESGTVYDSSKKVMTFSQDMDAVCVIVFKDATDFAESTATVSIRYTGNHPAFAVSNKCQSIGIFKRPDKNSSGATKAGLTIGDSTYIHTSNHQAITVTGENSNVGTMIDIYNSDVSGNTVSIGIGIGSGHVNRGIYDYTLGGWIVCTQSDKALHLGTANNTGGVVSDKYLTANGGLRVTGTATITNKAEISGQTTVTNGNVYMPTSGSNMIVINQTSQNYNTYSTTGSTYHSLLLKQSNGKTTAYIEHERTNTGNDVISVIAKHHTNDSTSAINKLAIGRSASANTYSVTDPSAFRAAIGANNAANINTGNLSYERIRSVLESGATYKNSTSSVLKLWHSGSGYMTLYFYGSIAVLNAFQVEVSKASTWETITQVATGCRPKYTVRAPLAAAGTPSYNGGVMEVNTSGYVRLYNPESATGNVMMSGSLSFIMAQ